MKPIDGGTEEQLQEVFAHVRNANHMILVCVDNEDRLVVIRKGIAEGEVPNAMRHLAQAIEDIEETERRAKAAEEFFESAPPDHKAICPGCEAPVILVTPLPPPEVLAQPNVTARCVCNCGSFLVPYYVDGALALRLMTVEEIADTPDEIRNTMLSHRRRAAAESARRKAH